MGGKCGKMKLPYFLITFIFMWARLEFGSTPESKQEYNPSSSDPQKALEKKALYNTAMKTVGTNLAKDMFENLAKGEPVNSEQFRHDMMTNPAFHRAVMQQWSTLDTKLADFIQTSGLANELYENNKTQLQAALKNVRTNDPIVDEINNGIEPQDLELYWASLVSENGQLTLVWHIVSDSKNGQNYSIKYSVSPEGKLSSSSYIDIVRWVKWRV